MIRHANENDAFRLAEINVFGWRTAYKGIIDDKILFQERSVHKRIDEFRNTIRNRLEETYVYEENEIIKGFMTIGGCRDEDKKDGFELWGIYIEPAMKGEGIGSRLMKYCEIEAKKRNKTEIYLWVLEKNSDAVKFYKKHGFIEEGLKKEITGYNVSEMRMVKKITF